MKGYAALHEPAAEVVDSLGGARTVVEGVGTIHAAETGPDGRTPAPFTLCGLDVNDLEKTPLDMPREEFDTWYPAGPHAKDICPECDRRVAGA